MVEHATYRNVVPEIGESARKMAFVHARTVPHAILFVVRSGEELTKGQVMARVNESLGDRFSPATFTRSYFELQIAQLIETENAKLRLTPLAVEEKEAYQGFVDSLAQPYKDHHIAKSEELGGKVPEEVKESPADPSIFTRKYLEEVFESFCDERKVALLATLEAQGETNKTSLSEELGFPYTSTIGILADLVSLGFATVDRRTIRITNLGLSALQGYKEYAQRLKKPFIVELVRQTERGFNMVPGTLTSIF